MLVTFVVEVEVVVVEETEAIELAMSLESLSNCEPASATSSSCTRSFSEMYGGGGAAVWDG